MALFASACGGAGPGNNNTNNTGGTASSGGERPDAVVLRFVPTTEARGSDRRIDLQLLGDGSLVLQGRRVGFLRADRATDEQGRELFHVESDGRIVLPNAPPSTNLRVTDDANTGGPEGRSIMLDPQGAPFGIVPGQPPQPGPFRLEGYTPARRRLGLLMMVVMLASRPEASAPPQSSEVPPPPPQQ